MATTRDAYLLLKDAVELPSPSRVALEIMHVAESEEATLDDVVAVIERDPATAARLMKLANSPLAGMPRHVTSLQQAVGLLGLRTVKSVAIGFSLVSQGRNGPCRTFDYDRFWSESVARAATARNVSHRCGGVLPDEAFICALLGRIGQLALATALPDSYAYAIEQVGQDYGDALLDVERELFGLDQSELTAEMMTDWHLPDIFAAAVRRQHMPVDARSSTASPETPLGTILRLATDISGILVPRTVRRKTLHTANLHANRLGIKPDAFVCVFDSIRAEWRDLGDLLDIPTRDTPTLGEIYSTAC